MIFLIEEHSMIVNSKQFVAVCLASTLSAIAIAQGSAPSAAPSSNEQAGKSGAMKSPRDGMCCGPNDTTGWHMMNRRERGEHHRMMHARKSYDECKATADEHHAKMVELAKQKGQAIPDKPMRDPCAWHKK
jgi:hypothetical protein